MNWIKENWIPLLSAVFGLMAVGGHFANYQNPAEAIAIAGVIGLVIMAFIAVGKHLS